ncbi:alanine racemase C-terminal domain-containing protein [Actinoplanes sp. M2I2]|uniref:alanine racemase C-terminal domain-containing protein n=1 Tax=Actinoplanes sp. M2I2 TaxID=1734444 RepID=UPI0035B4031D
MSTAGRAAFTVQGVHCPVLGRIAMDQVVDVGDLPVERDNVAVMFGPGEQGEPGWPSGPTEPAPIRARS